MDTKTFAILDTNNLVTNIIKWDGITKFDLPVGSTSQDITGASDVGIGYTFDGVKYIAPPPPPPEPPSEMQLLEDRVKAIEDWIEFIKPKLDAAGIK